MTTQKENDNKKSRPTIDLFDQALQIGENQLIGNVTMRNEETDIEIKPVFEKQPTCEEKVSFVNIKIQSNWIISLTMRDIT